MIDLTNIPYRTSYPPQVPPPKSQFDRIYLNKTLRVFKMGDYIIWSVAQGKTIKRNWTKFGLRRAIKKLESQGWLVDIDRYL